MNFVKEIEVSKGVLELRISRPEALNALNSLVLFELRKKLDDIRKEFYDSKSAGSYRADFPRVILISGEGGRAFVAGADIADLNGPDATSFLDEGIALMKQLEDLPLPVISVVTGFCLGGGLELALSCDLICATKTSKFGLPEVTLGIIPGFGGTQRLTKRCGIGLARKMILSGEKIDTEVACRSGIVDLVISEDLHELRVLTDKLANLSPLTLEAAKRALSFVDIDSREKGLKGEQELFVQLLQTEDAKEGMKAFFEKRGANFLGR